MYNLTVSFENKLVYKFILHLFDDPNFTIDDPVVDTYLRDVAYEMGLTPEQTSDVLNAMFKMSLLKIS